MEILGQRTVGPDMGQYDPVTDTGYYGLVSSTELIAGDVLATQIGLTAGVPQYNDGGWFKFYVGPEASCNRNNNGYAYVAYVAKMPNRYNVSWNHINAVNAVYGYRHEPLLGMNSQVRLITGAEADPTIFADGTNCLDNAGINSEWNELFYRIHEAIPDCSDVSIGLEGGMTTSRHGGPQNSETNWVEYTNSETGVLSNLNNGSASWCQERSGSTRVRRGYQGLAARALNASSLSDSNWGWRPVLQPTSPTVLLLHGSGTDGSTNITDSSVYNHPVTVHGNAQISTAQSVYPGGSSMYFDGDGDYFSIIDNKDLVFYGDFTIEFCVFCYNLINSGVIIGTHSGNHNFIELNADRGFGFFDSSSTSIIINVGTLNDSQWHHFAVTRSNGQVRMFMDGVIKHTHTSTALLDFTLGGTSPTFIGQCRTRWFFRGHIAELRLIKNRALYTTNFTPPTAPLPDPDPYDYSLFS